MILAAAVICYHPDQEVLDNIASYASGVDYLYVWDNTPGGSDLLKAYNAGIVLHNMHRNMGLPYAFNRIIELCKEKRVTHLMTMDQDSRFEHFDAFRNEIEIQEKSGGKFMYCPPLNVIWESENRVIHDAAQSGCVHSMRMIEEVGPFREDFFISMVDVEMQLRGVAAGYTILQIGGCNLIHRIGSCRQVSFLGHRVQVSDYSPLRCYYDSRNRILMWHEFPDDMCFSDKVRHLVGRIKVMTKILLFEDKKAPKIGAIIRGTWYGIWNKAVPFSKQQ